MHGMDMLLMQARAMQDAMIGDACDSCEVMLYRHADSGVMFISAGRILREMNLQCVQIRIAAGMSHADLDRAIRDAIAANKWRSA